MSIAGIDVGTTGCKCSVYSRTGEFLCESYREYHSEVTAISHVMDPLLVWQSIKEVISDVASEVEKIQVIGVTSFGEAAVLLNELDQPLMKSLLFTDPRGREECDRLIATLGISYLNKTTGLNPDIMYTISNLMWIKEHEPEIMEKCKRICLFEDYVVYMLSGVQQIDYSLATRTMAFNVNDLTWDHKILEVAGIDQSLLSTIVPVGTKAACIRKELLQELGLSSDTVIVSGCHDQVAAAVGTGVYRAGMAVDGTGTVECITNIYDKRDQKINTECLYQGSYAVVPFMEGLNIAYAFSFTGGALLKWYRDQLASHEARIARDNGENDYEHFNEELAMDHPSGLLVLPYFAGAGTPNMDKNAKGAILGLTLETTSIDLYKALMEGVTYEMRLNIEKLSEAGIEIETIRATGGGARSKKWLQIKADILRKPIVSLGAAQSGTLGCIMLAGLACGIYQTMEEAEATFVTVKETYYPRESIAVQYDHLYDSYRKVYQSIKDIL